MGLSEDLDRLQNLPKRDERSESGAASGWPKNVPEYSDAELVERAMFNAKPRIAGEAPLWVAVMDTFGTGSTVAHALCRKYGRNPDEKVSGVRCISCNP